MRIFNGSKSVGFTTAAICFVLAAAYVSANPNGFEGRQFPPHMEAFKDDNRVRKAGQIVELQIDTDTNLVTATVALGSINKPERPEKMNEADNAAPKGERTPPKFITLNGEKVKVDLDDKVKVIEMKPPVMPKRHDNWREDRNENRNNGCRCCGNGDSRRKSHHARPNHDFNGKHDVRFGEKRKDMKKWSGGNSLKIGEVVQVVYSEDGKTVEAIVPIMPPMPQKAKR